MQNGFIDRFNGQMQDELLSETLFFDPDDAAPRLRPGPPTTISGSLTRR